MMASTSSSATRRSRTTNEQLCRMVDFLTATPGMAGSRFLKMHGKAECDKKWAELAAILNSLGGAVKSVEQWRTVWRDLKSRTSIRVRDRKRKQARTGNNPINEEPPTELERRVIALIGKDYTQGDDTCMENVPEMEELQLRMEEGDESTIIVFPTESQDESGAGDSCLHVRTYTPITPARRTPRSGAKRRRVQSDSEAENNFLQIAQTQASALQMLAEANVKQGEALKMLAESNSKVGDALKMIAESNRENVEVNKSLAEGLKACAEAFTNLTSAIYRSDK